MSDVRLRRQAWLLIAIPVGIALLGAWLYRWVDEDAFINFRIVANVVAGHGPVYNVGERVETYSDPLWVASLTAFQSIGPWVGIEWWSVILGLGTTAGGMVLGGRGIQHLLDRDRDAGTTVPVGLVIFSVVAGVWQFITSGLEMGMVFLWLGLSFWLLVRLADRRRNAGLPGFVIGLGVLIRPELIVMAAVLLTAVGILVGMPGWRGSTSFQGRWLQPLAAAAALPVAYEVWRMAYFAMLVPNTGLAKSAGSSWWSEGFDYLWNFLSPYTLWLAILLAVPLVALEVRHFARHNDRVAIVVLATPVIAALFDTVYVVKIGGDYMHARLLLPAFFALSLVIAVRIENLRTWIVVPTVAIGVWAIVCAGWLRNTENGIDPIIINSRNNSVALTHMANPITADDYEASVLGEVGQGLHVVGTPPSEHGKRMFVGAFRSVPARSSLPFTVATASGTIGVVGYLAGPNVYIFDVVSLANPIGSHTTSAVKLRPGHDKPISVVWMYARFGVPGDSFGVDPQSVAEARQAMACPPLRSYLHAITAPLTFGLAASNFVHSIGYTTMSFSADPRQAVNQLCG